ncbi:MAG: hypothetical protein K9I29_03720 [Bacteroidales bacterium]|nr:hypothetical protein [Bacteroidales bacterium]MCF8327380.1 hypothetical protein [Bacteroidales bacterium]
MLHKTLLILMLLPFALGMQAQDNNSMLVVRFAEENIEIDNSTRRFIDNKDISEEVFFSKIKKIQQKAIEDVIAREGYEIKGIKQQVSLLPSEFANLEKQQSIDKLSEDINRSFFQKILNVFNPGNPDWYMSSRFSSDKKDRISTTLQQQDSKYALFLHKFEVKRSLCGEAQLITHFSLLNDESEIVLGGQNIYYADMKNSMNKNVLNHLLETAFIDTFAIIFDKLK